MDEDLPRRSDDLVAKLAAEDLDRLSVAELEARVAMLEAEVARTRARMAGAASHRATADSLFRQ